MRKLLTLSLLLFSIITLTACATKTKTTLNVMFVPSRSDVDILEVTEPLKERLLTELNNLGFDFKKVNISLASSYSEAAIAASKGTQDVVFLNGETYIKYEETLTPLLASSRNSLSKNSENPSVWNDGLPTTEVLLSKDAVTYRSLIVAGQSARGRYLASLVNNGTVLTWDEIKSAKFCIGGNTSYVAYKFPELWLKEEFGKSFEAMANTVLTLGDAHALTLLENKECDIAAIASDSRMYNPFSEGDIFQLTDVIYVSEPIATDGLFVGNHIDQDLQNVLQTAFMNLINDSVNDDIFAIYSHYAYAPITSTDYDGIRKIVE